MEIAAARIIAQKRLKEMLASRRGRKPEQPQSAALPVTEFRRRGFKSLREAIPQQVIEQSSRLMCDEMETRPAQVMQYSGKEWLASRSYVEEGSLTYCTSMAAIFDPLLVRVQELMEKEDGGMLCLESAFANMYNADKGEVGMSWHQDCLEDGGQSQISCVLQGVTHQGCEGGGLLCRLPGDEQEVQVNLVPGDCLALKGSCWHKALDITDGKRITFVFFYKVAHTAEARHQVLFQQLAPLVQLSLNTWQCTVPSHLFSGRPMRLLHETRTTPISDNTFALCDWISENAQSMVRDHVVLELGAGFHGIVGIACSRLGACEVILTDAEPTAVSALEVNSTCEKLGSPHAVITACTLDWKSQDGALGGHASACLLAPDVVVASVLIRDSQSIDKLVATLERLLIERELTGVLPTALVAWESRPTEEQCEEVFLERLTSSQLSFSIVEIPQSGQAYTNVHKVAILKAK